MTGVSKLNTIPEGKMPHLLITFFAVVILYSSFAIPTCFAGTTWQAIGPFGGQIPTIAIDPTDSQTVYAGTYSGVFKSTNGGASWTTANSGLTNTSTLFSGRRKCATDSLLSLHS